MERFKVALRQKADGAFAPRLRPSKDGNLILYSEYGELIKAAMRLSLYLNAGVFDKDYRGAVEDLKAAANAIRAKEK